MAAAHAETFKVLKADEYKKLSKEQKLQYVKEFAKRLGTTKTKDRRSSASPTSLLQYVISEILPAAHADEPRWITYQREQEAATNKSIKPLEERERVLINGKVAKLEADKKKAELEADRANRAIQRAEEKLKALPDQLTRAQQEFAQIVASNPEDDHPVERKKIEDLREEQSQLKEDLRLAKEALKSSKSTFSDENEKQLEYYKNMLQRDQIGQANKEQAIKEVRETNEKLEAKKKELKVESVLGKEELDEENKKLAQLEKDLAKEKDPEAKEEIKNLIQISKNKIARKERELKDLGIEVRGLTLKKENSEIAAGLKEQSTVNGKDKLTELAKKNEERKARFAKYKETGRQQDAAKAAAKAQSAPASGKPEVTGGGPSGGSAPTPAAKDGEKKLSVQTLETAKEFCPNAGFVIGLGDDGKNANCPNISSAADERYIGKITKGPAAKASCGGESKTYSKESSVLCYPLIFGLTKDDEGICVTPGNDVSARCAAESRNKNGAEKAVQIINENPEAMDQYANAYSKMCKPENIKANPFRAGDVKWTCDTLEVQINTVGAVIKAKEKSSTTPAAPAEGAK